MKHLPRFRVGRFDMDSRRSVPTGDDGLVGHGQ